MENIPSLSPLVDDHGLGLVHLVVDVPHRGEGDDGGDTEDNDEREDDETGGDGGEFFEELEDGNPSEEAAADQLVLAKLSFAYR